MSTSTPVPLPDLTPTQRREQVAAILARGLLRTFQLATPESPPETLEFSAAGLEVPGETRLSVSRVCRIGDDDTLVGHIVRDLLKMGVSARWGMYAGGPTRQES